MQDSTSPSMIKGSWVFSLRSIKNPTLYRFQKYINIEITIFKKAQQIIMVKKGLLHLK